MSKVFDCWSGMSTAQKKLYVVKTGPRRLTYKWRDQLGYMVSGELLTAWSHDLKEIEKRTGTVDFERMISPRGISTPVNWTLYLVGDIEHVESLKQTIVAEACGKELATAACNALKEMKQYGLQSLLKHYEIHYRDVSLRLRSDDITRQSSSRDSGTSSARISLCGVQAITVLNVTQPSDEAQSKTATVGGAVTLDGTTWALTVGHIFKLPEAVSSLDAIEIVNVYAQQCDRNLIDPATNSIPPQPISSATHINCTTSRVHVSQSEDWALIPVENPNFCTTNRFRRPGGGLVTVSGIADEMPSGPITAVTGVSEPTQTRFRAVSLLLLPGSVKPRIAWSASMASAPGDSGSWLVDTKDRACAMIVAASEDDQEVFCLPLMPIFDGARRMLGSTETPSLAFDESGPKMLNSTFPREITGQNQNTSPRTERNIANDSEPTTSDSTMAQDHTEQNKTAENRQSCLVHDVDEISHEPHGSDGWDTLEKKTKTSTFDAESGKHSPAAKIDSENEADSKEKEWQSILKQRKRYHKRCSKLAKREMALQAKEAELQKREQKMEKNLLNDRAMRHLLNEQFLLEARTQLAAMGKNTRKFDDPEHKGYEERRSKNTRVFASRPASPSLDAQVAIRAACDAKELEFQAFVQNLFWEEELPVEICDRILELHDEERESIRIVEVIDQENELDHPTKRADDNDTSVQRRITYRDEPPRRARSYSRQPPPPAPRQHEPEKIIRRRDLPPPRRYQSEKSDEEDKKILITYERERGDSVDLDDILGIEASLARRRRRAVQLSSDTGKGSTSKAANTDYVVRSRRRDQYEDVSY